MVAESNRQTVINWMKKQRWYLQYKTNAMMNFLTTGSIFRNEDIEDFIAAAFDWESAPEGFEYWNNINENYLDFLESIS